MLVKFCELVPLSGSFSEKVNFHSSPSYMGDSSSEKPTVPSSPCLSHMDTIHAHASKINFNIIRLAQAWEMVPSLHVY